MLIAASTASASDAQLVRARHAYQEGQYEQTIQILYPLLHVGNDIDSLSKPEQIEAHKLLGISYYFKQDYEHAHDEFFAALLINPDFALDPVVDDPNVYKFVADLKTKFNAELAAVGRRVLYVERDIRSDAAWKNFYGFGYGQFRNGQSTKGNLFFATEFALALTSAGAFGAQLANYGPPFSKVPNSEVSTVNTLELVQFGAGALFVVVYTLGVIDGYAHMKEPVVERRHEKLLKQGEQARWTPVIVPVVSSQSVGLAAGWEF